MFKVEAKVETTPYQVEMDVVKLNQWLQQLDVYFIVYDIGKEFWISVGITTAPLEIYCGLIATMGSWD